MTSPASSPQLNQASFRTPMMSGHAQWSSDEDRVHFEAALDRADTSDSSLSSNELENTTSRETIKKAIETQSLYSFKMDLHQNHHQKVGSNSTSFFEPTFNSPA